MIESSYLHVDLLVGYSMDILKGAKEISEKEEITLDQAIKLIEISMLSIRLKRR